MKRAGFSAALLALGLSGCVHYAPAPPRPAAFVTGFEDRQLYRGTKGPWTGADLLASAIERNPQIAEARAKYLVAVAAARAAKTPPGSALTLTAEYADESPHWGYSGGVSVPLDYGTRRSVRVTTANLQALQAFYDFGETVWSVRSDLERARIDLLAAREEITLAREARAVRLSRLALLNRRVAAGQDARSVAIIAQGEAQSANARLAAAQGRRNLAVSAMGKALGVGESTADLLMEPASAAAPPYDLERLRNEAALSRRDVLRAVADYDIAENALRLEVANQYPQVSLGPAYNYDHGVTKLPFSLALSLPPVDLNRRAIAQAEAARVAAGRSLELALANALSDVDTAKAALAAAGGAAKGARDDLRLAIQSESSVRSAVEAGQSDRVDQLAARGALLDAQLGLHDAGHAVSLARVDLEDALRRAFDPAEAAVIQTTMHKVRVAR